MEVVRELKNKEVVLIVSDNIILVLFVEEENSFFSIAL